jgi:hypothetical protein
MNWGDFDAFIMKLNGNGTLAYSTLLGGAKLDDAYSLDVTSAGAAIVVGATYSSDFPIRKAFQKFQPGASDAFVAKISPSGKTIIYSTYLGGIQTDDAQSVAIDTKGNAYVTGRTRSTTFPLQNAFQMKKKRAADSFITKFSPSGSLIYSSFVGGNFYDWGLGVAVNKQGVAYLTGTTDSTSFPIVNAIQPKKGGDILDIDAFIVGVVSSPSSRK